MIIIQFKRLLRSSKRKSQRGKNVLLSKDIGVRIENIFCLNQFVKLLKNLLNSIYLTLFCDPYSRRRDCSISAICNSKHSEVYLAWSSHREEGWLAMGIRVKSTAPLILVQRSSSSFVISLITNFLTWLTQGKHESFPCFVNWVFSIMNSLKRTRSETGANSLQKKVTEKPRYLLWLKTLIYLCQVPQPDKTLSRYLPTGVRGLFNGDPYLAFEQLV